MDINHIVAKIQFLNPSLKKEVNDFVDFLLSKQNKGENKTARFGCAQGRFKMAPDFDEPLDDFKDYM